MATAPLEVAGVEKRFGGVVALDGVTLTLNAGEVLGLLGPNGSGKTTLVNCLSGVLLPDEGAITFRGHDITHWSRVRRAGGGLIRTYQNLRLFSEMSVAENIAVGLSGRRTLKRAERDRLVLSTISSHGLEEIRRLPVKNLSYGQQRRVEIARALIARPHVLLLDEPAAGLGESDTEQLARAIDEARTESGCAVILIDHDVRFVTTTSDRIIVMHKGQIVRDGSPQEVQSDPLVARIYLGSGEEGHQAAVSETAETRPTDSDGPGGRP